MVSPTSTYPIAHSEARREMRHPRRARSPTPTIQHQRPPAPLATARQGPVARPSRTQPQSPLASPQPQRCRSRSRSRASRAASPTPISRVPAHSVRTDASNAPLSQVPHPHPHPHIHSTVPQVHSRHPVISVPPKQDTYKSNIRAVGLTLVVGTTPLFLACLFVHPYLLVIELHPSAGPTTQGRRLG